MQDALKNLLQAIKSGSEKKAIALLRMPGIDVNMKSGKSAWEGYSEIAKLLLQMGANANDRDADGWTALISTAYNGNIEIAKLLLHAQAKIDLRDHRGNTALLHAIWEKHVKIVELLIENGADV